MSIKFYPETKHKSLAIETLEINYDNGASYAITAHDLHESVLLSLHQNDRTSFLHGNKAHVFLLGNLEAVVRENHDAKHFITFEQTGNLFFIVSILPEIHIQKLRGFYAQHHVSLLRSCTILMELQDGMELEDDFNGFIEEVSISNEAYCFLPGLIKSF